MMKVCETCKHCELFSVFSFTCKYKGVIQLSDNCHLWKQNDQEEQT